MKHSSDWQHTRGQGDQAGPGPGLSDGAGIGRGMAHEGEHGVNADRVSAHPHSPYLPALSFQHSHFNPIYPCCCCCCRPTHSHPEAIPGAGGEGLPLPAHAHPGCHPTARVCGLLHRPHQGVCERHVGGACGSEVVQPAKFWCSPAPAPDVSPSILVRLCRPTRLQGTTWFVVQAPTA